MFVKDAGIINGEVVKEALLESDGSSVSVLSFGGITKSWTVKFGSKSIPIVLGFDSLDAYKVDKNFVGIIAGRVANRTQNGRFKLGTIEYQLPINDYPNHLHGGSLGFGKKNWELEFDSKNCAVQLHRVSAHLEQGYPGVVDVTVMVKLHKNTVTYEMSAIPDRPTPINLAQHNYYNLMGKGNIWGHYFESVAKSYTPMNEMLIPTGSISDLESYGMKTNRAQWNLSSPKTLAQLDPKGVGIDMNLVFPAERNKEIPVAAMTAKNGLKLEIFTDQPGLQLYSGKNLSGNSLGHTGKKYEPFEGFCLEPQKFPSSLTIPTFPSIIFTPENHYKQVTSIKVSTPLE